MSWQLDVKVAEILKRAENGDRLNTDDIYALLGVELHSKEVYALMHTADRLSRVRFNGKGENHFHIGVNTEPCPFNCQFCSLGEQAGIFTECIEFDEFQIVAWARDAEANHADALNIMTTGTYSFDRLLEIGRLLASAVAVPLVANTRDITHKEGEKLLAAGFVGAYHALRLGEGRDTPFPREKRLHTINVFKDVGLLWMNCVEPVGPEHGKEEIAELMILARDYSAVYSGVMRRINFPGSPFERFGMITEFEMARMVAVSRLVMGDVPRAHCTHEPHAVSLLAGANLFFPEVGASPRDSQADTGKGRGYGIDRCRKMFVEMGWNPDLLSNCFD